MLVIINADDLGISSRVNDTVFELIARNKITSATILANGPQVADAIKMVPHFPGCSFGIHLNVTEFEPVSTRARVKVLLDQNGQFRQDFRKRKLTVRVLQAVYTEFAAQVERLLEYGVRPSHIDSHHHVHTIPALFPVLKLIQSRYGLYKVRTTMNMYPNGDLSAGLRAKKRVYHWALGNVLRTKTTQAFTDLRTFCAVWKSFKRPHGTVEIMVHPGAAGSEEETARLETPWLEDLGSQARMINFHQL